MQLSPNWNWDVVPIYLRLTTFDSISWQLSSGNVLPVPQCPCLLAVRLLLRPAFSHTQVGSGDIKETTFCNVTEDISLSEPKKGLTPPSASADREPVSQQFHTVSCWGILACAASFLSDEMQEIAIQRAAYGCLLFIPERSPSTHM